ncbi:hypothetical protein [Paenibacillus turpanensis]|uniref:hypothetical protein n=1 Tax=Paenibacillus turpanensis TaxID=2689078 RepID=UPI00140C0E79|nr:hypothetical protein [Paenibacillus turpanensis]
MDVNELLKFWIPLYGFVLLVLVNGFFYLFFYQQNKPFRELLDLQHQLNGEPDDQLVQKAIELASRMKRPKDTEDNRNALRPLLLHVQRSEKVAPARKQELERLLLEKGVIQPAQ